VRITTDAITGERLVERVTRTPRITPNGVRYDVRIWLEPLEESDDE
jgi:hypothetical protein